MKDRLLKDFITGLIKQLKQLDSKYINRQNVKEDISKWSFKLSTTTQIVLNHITKKSEESIFNQRDYSNEASIMLKILSIIFSITEEHCVKNTLISLFSKYKVNSLSKYI
jgi:hypothetical protein